MPNITMLDIEELRKTKLQPYIDKCLEHRAPDPGFHAMMGHNIDLCEAMFVAWDACFNNGRIPHTAQGNHPRPALPRGDLHLLRECPVCFGEATGTIGRAARRRHRQLRRERALHEAEKIALRYSELMSVNPDAVDAAFFDELRKHYSDDEIVELGAFIGFNLGYHTFFGTLKFYPLFSPDGRLVTPGGVGEALRRGAGLAQIRRPPNDPYRAAAARGDRRSRTARPDRRGRRRWACRTICSRASSRARRSRPFRSCARS